MGFVAELQRRNVIRVAGLYLVGAWLAVQVAGTLLPIFGAPGWVARTVVVAIAAAFLPALAIAWVFELTPQGFRRERDADPGQPMVSASARRIEHAIVVVLALALAVFAFDKFVLAPRERLALQQTTARSVAEARKQGGAEALTRSYGDKSIAVLPFANMSSDKEQEYFADGIAEELLNRLARIHGLRVIARTSSFSFKGKDADIATIAQALHVAYLLEGSVRRSGDQLRIGAKLIRAADSAELWSGTYDRTLADVFAVQDEIAKAVVAQLELKLLGELQATTVVDPQAYALYLQARQIRYLRTPAAYEQAEDLLRRALALEPRFAEAWVQLSMVYRNQADGGLRSNAEGYRLARDAANRALALEPDLVAARAELAVNARIDRDLAGSAMHLSRAVALAPDDPVVLRAAAALANGLGRQPQAIEFARAVVLRDPHDPTAHSLLGNAYWFAGRLDESIASFRETTRLSPAFISAHASLGDVLLSKGDPQAALAEVQQEPGGPWRLIGLAQVFHALGRHQDSDAALAELTKGYARDAAFNIAYIHAFRGDNDLAFAWLDRALAYRDPGLSEVAVHPTFARVRSDPRWLPFLRKLGMAPEQLAAIRFDAKPPTPERR